MFLADHQIRDLIENNSLITGYRDLEDQIQPNGFDFTLDQVFTFNRRATASILQYDKIIPEQTERKALEYADYSTDGETKTGWLLEPGSYFIRFAETVKLPEDLIGLGRPRSTLVRTGSAIHTGVWDSGYEGKSGSLLVVTNPTFFEYGAKVMQMVFAQTVGSTDTYNGSYQGE